MKKPLTQAEALHKAAAYCTLCERCISEVATKLTQWGIVSSEQQAIIERLQEEGFIDEERYCRAFVNDKVRFNRWGRIKITASLREKRLPAEFILEAVKNINTEEYTQSLKDVIESKRRELNSKDDIASQQKIIRYAASRGFEPSIILTTIKYKGDEMDF